MAAPTIFITAAKSDERIQCQCGSGRQTQWISDAGKLYCSDCTPEEVVISRVRVEAELGPLPR